MADGPTIYKHEDDNTIMTMQQQGICIILIDRDDFTSGLAFGTVYSLRLRNTHRSGQC